MSKIVTNDRHYYAIADAIREKLGVDNLFRPSEMGPAIRQISYEQQTIVTVPLSVSKNGTYQTDSVRNAFDNIVVDVDTSVPREELIASRNGDYYPTEGTLFSIATVSVPIEYLSSASIDITSNGTYEPQDGYAYTRVFVNVPQYRLQSIDIVRDGSYSISSGYLYDSVTVNVPSIDRTDFYSVFNQQTRSISNSDITNLRPYAFYYSMNVNKVDFPNVTNIGSNAFFSCAVLQSVNLPKVKTIQENAFQNCNNLSTITLPACSFISSGAFQSCSKLRALYLLSTAIVSINSFTDVFRSTSINLGYIYVPSSLLNAYKTHAQWGTVSSRISAYTP